MILKRFNDARELIEFDPATGKFQILGSIPEGTRIVGVADIIANNLVALTFGTGEPSIYLGSDQYAIKDPSVRLDFEHLPQGKSRFSVGGSSGVTEIVYPSWWQNESGPLVVFDDTSDEAEDFCAYLVYMLGSTDSYQGLVKRYGQQAEPGTH